MHVGIVYIIITFHNPVIPDTGVPEPPSSPLIERVRRLGARPWGSQPHVSFVFFVVSRITILFATVRFSPRLKKTSVRQVALDKWLPLRLSFRYIGNIYK